MHIDEYSRETNEALSDPVNSRGNSILFKAFKRSAENLKDAREAPAQFAHAFKIAGAFISLFKDTRLSQWDNNKEQVEVAIIDAVQAQLVRTDNHIASEGSRLALAEAALNAVVTFKPSTLAVA